MTVGNAGLEKTASGFLDLPTGWSIKRVYKAIELIIAKQKFDSKFTDLSS